MLSLMLLMIHFKWGAVAVITAISEIGDEQFPLALDIMPTNMGVSFLIHINGPPESPWEMSYF